MDSQNKEEFVGGDNYQQPEDNGGSSESGNLNNLPSITLPKGGGAIKSIDDRLSVNAINGTAGFSIPLPVSPARQGFQPDLDLSYNSGQGNGPFGMGWALSIPSISRKSQNKLPQYLDGDDSDTFVITGAEDLVPLLVNNGSSWQRFLETRTEEGINYQVVRYRPRIEAGFVRIERWQNTNTGDLHWRSISPDNVTSIYGRDPQARISDPADPRRTSQWLIESSYDDVGNTIRYRYKAEDLDGVTADRLHEKNRLNGLAPITNTYLKRIQYGAKTPYKAGQPLPEFMFEIVLDYGEHDQDNPQPDDAGTWSVRHDPFSSYRNGFEIRTYRRCQRTLLFHNFEELADTPTLVSSLSLNYDDAQAGFSFLTEAIQRGYIRKDDGSYNTKPLPPFTFEYQKHEWNTEVKTVTDENIVHAPSGVGAPQYRGSEYQWLDLYSEGLSGILTEQGSGLYYKSNLGNGEFSHAQPVAPRPSFTGLAAGAVQIQDLEATGEKQLVYYSDNQPQGFFKLGSETEVEAKWRNFKPFKQIPNIDFSDPNLKFIDLDGDGRAELLISEDEVFRWYPSEGEQGYGESRLTQRPMDEELGPAIVFADATQSIFLANMAGDSLLDIVRIRNGEVVYWPNLGYGRFGAKVNMSHAPVFDHPDSFNPQYLRLADLDGSGTTDIIYLGKDEFCYWLNLSGNDWSLAQRNINPFPELDNHSQVTVLDLLGTGTGCIVWSSPLEKHTVKPLKYIDLMDSKQPHVMKAYQNNMGKEVRFFYKASTQFYLEDKKAGQPWITKLPFPVQCVFKVESLDHISRTRYSSEYSYHHGYYDHAEREFRGFGRVDQIDSETFEHFIKTDASNVVEEDLHQPPVLSRTWFHTGAFLDRERILSQFAHEYYQNESMTEYQLPEPELPADLTTAEWREALRACKGIALRTELYALDGSDKEAHPYSVAQNNCQVRRLQPKESNKHAVFLTLPSESISYHYERNPADPRISHSLTLETDELGNVLKAAAVAYPRQLRDESLPLEIQTEQAKQQIIYSETDYTHDIDINTPLASYRLRQACETRSYELTGVVPTSGNFFQLTELYIAATTAGGIGYEIETDGSLQKRILEQTRTYFLKDDLSGPLPLRSIEALGLGYEVYQLAFTPTLVRHIYGDKISGSDALFTEGAYVHTVVQNELDNNWWVPSGTARYPANAADHFYLPMGTRDSFGYESTVWYDAYDLLVRKTKDALNNEATAQHDYRILQPVLMTDPNLNRTAVETDELGMVVKTAVMGKEGAGEGDTLDEPTTYLEYDLFNWLNSNTNNNGKPNFAHSFAREKHGGDNSRWQESYSYSDGGGNVAMVKVQAEPGFAKQVDDEGNVTEIDTTPDVRWVGNGRIVLNNKGNPVKQYEPYFSITHEYEDNPKLVELGVTPIMYYDPLDRLIKAENPNGTFSKVEFDPWRQLDFDVNDTVLQSQWYVERGSPDPGGLEPSDSEQRAAWLAAKHANTPAVVHSDSLGRAVLGIYDNGLDGKYLTRTILDIENNPLEIIDDRGNRVMEYRYSLLTEEEENEQEQQVTLYQNSMDAGERWVFVNVTGNPIRSWDSRDHLFRSEYDKLHRPTHSWLKKGVEVEKLIGLTIYGETVVNSQVKNFHGQVFQVYDQAGQVQSNGYDFKGNLQSGTRRLTTEYKTTIDWNVTDPTSLLQDEFFETSSEYDALGRVTRSLSPNNPQIPASEIIPLYNEANLLNEVKVKLRGATEETSYVNNIDYDAKGQRQRIEYGNGVITDYEYDPLTYRLIKLSTTRTTDQAVLQDLSYSYDPVGNITAIKDAAQQTVFFDNTEVLPSTSYEYDALYRLTQAKGREHTAQNNTQRDATDFVPVIGIPHPNSPEALQRYIEQYHYDTVGNILSMAHTGGTDLRWKRCYQYAQDSNRLLATGGAGEFQNAADPCPDHYVPAPTLSQRYGYDDHGNMTRMPHLADIKWDFADQMQQVDLGGGGTTYYVYDASGERVRKVVKRNGSTVEERIYLGGFEIYRKKNGSGPMLERETLHIMDDEQRIAMVETKTFDRDAPVSAPVPIVRYQLGNHLGSASLELDDENGGVISYEEYHSYGTSAYRAGRSAAEVSLKRYRYTGMERDEETGLNYHGARYYVPWLGRWISADPMGIRDGANLYQYVRSNPPVRVDSNGMQSHPSTQRKRNSNKQPANDIVARRENITGAAQDISSLLSIPDISEVSKDVSNFLYRGRNFLKGKSISDPLAKLAANLSTKIGAFSERYLRIPGWNGKLGTWSLAIEWGAKGLDKLGVPAAKEVGAIADVAGQATPVGLGIALGNVAIDLPQHGAEKTSDIAIAGGYTELVQGYAILAGMLGAHARAKYEEARGNQAAARNAYLRFEADIVDMPTKLDFISEFLVKTFPRGAKPGDAALPTPPPGYQVVIINRSIVYVVPISPANTIVVGLPDGDVMVIPELPSDYIYQEQTQSVQIESDVRTNWGR